MKDMVRYVYSGKVSNLPDKSDLLLSAADNYDIRDLKEDFVNKSLHGSSCRCIDPVWHA